MIDKFEVGKLYGYYEEDKLETLEICLQTDLSPTDLSGDREYARLLVVWTKNPGRWESIVFPNLTQDWYTAYEEVK